MASESVHPGGASQLEIPSKFIMVLKELSLVFNVVFLEYWNLMLLVQLGWWVVAFLMVGAVLEHEEGEWKAYGWGLGFQDVKVEDCRRES